MSTVAVEELIWRTIPSYTDHKKTSSLVGYPKTTEEVISLMDYAKKENMSICFRGAGNTFGDVILNDRQMVIETRYLSKILKWSPVIGQIVVGGGTNLGDVFKNCYSDNWTLTAIPGSLDVTIVGAISNNVHGKDSVHCGSFGDQVISLKIITPSEGIIEVSRTHRSNIFYAAIGGMGLLGPIIEVTLQLKKIESPYVETFMIPVRNIDDCVKKLDKAAKENDFVVSWVDPFLKGRKMGRGFIRCANWVKTRNSYPVNEKKLQKSLTSRTKIFGIIPASLFWFCCRPMFFHSTVKYLNILTYWINWFICKLGLDRGKQLFTDYNFIIRKLPKIKEVYRPYGTLELQPMVAAKYGADAIREMFELGQKEGFESLLCVIKKHRPDPYLFSYSGDSYSIGWTTHLKNRTQEEVLAFNDKLLALQFKYEGKTFLAKDDLLTPETFAAVFPEYKNFLQIKKQLDPDDLFSSDYYKKTIKPLAN